MTPADKGLVLHRYSITVEAIPEPGKIIKAPVGKKVKQIIALMLELDIFRKNIRVMATDFKTWLITCNPLPPSLLKHEVEYYLEGDNSPRKDAKKYNIHLAPTPSAFKLDITDLMAFLNSDASDSSFMDRLPMLQALNILLSHSMKSSPKIITIGSNRGFSVDASDHRKDLGGGLIALKGYFMSARLATCRTLVNVNVTHTSFYDKRQCPIGRLDAQLRHCELVGPAKISERSSCQDQLFEKQ